MKDRSKYHTRGDLLKAGVINYAQLDKVTVATRELKQRSKFLSNEQLQTTDVLENFMDALGFPKPQWNPRAIKESLDAVLHWNDRVIPLSKYILHNVTANRQEMTKNVKAELISK